jgi:hypothetical protein
MTWTMNTGCKYHTQDTYYYCGAASAMMILAEIGVPYSQLDQVDLYNSNNSHNKKSGWYTDPYGLQFTLNDRSPSSHYYFIVNKPTNEPEGTRKIIYYLQKYGVSPAVLVYGCGHWIVVCGTQTDVDPTTGPYTLDGFWINNPVWLSSPPPPPHDSIDACGSGGIYGLGNQFVTYATWQTDYFTGCNYDDPGGNQQFISVCDPDVPNIALPLRRPKTYLAEGKVLLSHEKVMIAAKAGLERYHLDKSEFSAEVIRRGGVTGRPQLVQRLDRLDSYYYLVPLQTDERTPVAFAQIDAKFGFFNSLQLLTSPKGGSIKQDWYISRESINGRLDGQRFELPDCQGRLTIRDGTYSVSPTLVWAPCRESFSPHLPFHQITAGSQQLYVRVDGAIFTSLTPSKFGD